MCWEVTTRVDGGVICRTLMAGKPFREDYTKSEPMIRIASDLWEMEQLSGLEGREEGRRSRVIQIERERE